MNILFFLFLFCICFVIYSDVYNKKKNAKREAENRKLLYGEKTVYEALLNDYKLMLRMGNKYPEHQEARYFFFKQAEELRIKIEKLSIEDGNELLISVIENKEQKDA